MKDYNLKKITLGGPMGIFKMRLVGILTILSFCSCSMTLMGAGVSNWDSIRERLNKTETDEGRKEIAKEIGFDYVSKRLKIAGLGTKGLQFLAEACGKTSEASLLKGFNSCLEKLGLAMIFFQFADDINNQRSTFETCNNLMKNSSFFMVSISAHPVLKIAVGASQAFKAIGVYMADLAYTGDDKIWWTMYEEYFKTDNGKLAPEGWVKLLKDGNVDAYKAHMDSFFTMEGTLFVKGYSKKGMTVPRVADPEDLAVRKLAEVFRIRFFKLHLEKNLGEWAVQEAQRAVDLEAENLGKELALIVANGIIRIKVQDDVDRAPVRGAWVEVKWTDEVKGEKGSYGKTGEDGLVDLKEVPPWIQGILTVEKPGYTLGKEDNLANFFSTKDAPKEVPITIVAYGVKLKGLVVKAETGKPIPGARISAKMTNGGAVISGVTEGDGAASLAFPKAGDALFTVSAEEFATLEETRRVDVIPGKEARDEVFRLSSKGGVTVGVLARDAKASKPLSGVTVICKMESQTETGTTGADGRAKIVFSKGSAKTVSLTFSLLGYTSKTMSQGVDEGKVQTVADLEPGAGKVTVVVKAGPKGEPVSGAKIEVSPGEGKGTTGEDGAVEIAVAVAEKFVVTCAKKGFPPAKATAEMKDGIAKVTILVDTKMAVLKVTVGDKKTSDPLKGVKVKATVDGVETIGTTDEYGKLELEIPLGQTVKVHLSKKGYEAVEVKKNIVDGKVSVGGTMAPDGQAIFAMTLKDRSTGRLLKGVKVEGGGKSAVSKADGVAQLEAVPEQEVMISASLKGYEDRTGSGKAPKGGEVKKIGWYLDAVASEKPKPQPGPPATGGGDYSSTLTVKNVSMSFTISGVKVTKVSEHSSKSNLDPGLEISHVTVAQGLITGKEIHISGTYSCTLTGTNAGANYRVRIDPTSGGGKMVESSQGKNCHPIKAPAPMSYSQSFDLIFPVGETKAVKIYVRAGTAYQAGGLDTSVGFEGKFATDPKYW